jgi:HK97 family phage major capsid protein
MKGIQALRERKNHLAKEMNNSLTKVGDRVWTPEEQKAYDDLSNEFALLKQQISAHEKALEEDETYIVNQLKSNGSQANPDASAALQLYLRKRPDSLSAKEIEVVRNAMSTTTGAEGGFTVDQTVAKLVVDAMKAYGGMRSVATVLSVENGASMSMPESDGTSEEGEIVGQNASATLGEITFTSHTHEVYKWSSRYLALPWELIQDSGINMVDFVITRLATRIARGSNRKYTAGTGTNEPFGVVTRSGVGLVGATGSATTVTYDQIVRLDHSIDPAYRARSQFMMHDDTVLAIRLIKDGSQRPIFVPGYETGNPGGAPDRLLNRPIVVNQHMPVMAANAKSILAGDFSYYWIRDVMNTEIRVFDDSAFALKGQRGFCGWARSGGQLTSTNAVKHFQNSAT